MAEKWFISDTHFFHANILKFVGNDGNVIRPFNDVTEMNEYIIRKWNNTVAVHDKVYHLGDVTFKYGHEFVELMSRLNGQKRLIIGNHDRLKGTELMRWFEKVELWKGFKEGDFTATHIPLRLESLRDGNFNVHGHIHQNVMEDPHYINVCVEQWNYTPVNYDEIVKKIKAVK